mmetsp:Transcript_66224/g.185157  ORF Transcript_66224/g.185157 Transcript_66224/m.185157 type:complete len:201 (+) Transcript_66224:1053-1655(+)
MGHADELPAIGELPVLGVPEVPAQVHVQGVEEQVQRLGHPAVEDVQHLVQLDDVGVVALLEHRDLADGSGGDALPRGAEAVVAEVDADFLDGEDLPRAPLRNPVDLAKCPLANLLVEAEAAEDVVGSKLHIVAPLAVLLAVGLVDVGRPRPVAVIGLRALGHARRCDLFGRGVRCVDDSAPATGERARPSGAPRASGIET